MIASIITEKRKLKFAHYLATLRFALYCITHPLDGFWDLTHEKRGSYAAANTILALTLLVRVMKLRYTSFIFMTVYWETLNIFLYLASILFPLALWVVGNWALTTLFDGKGRLGQVYMASCYALTPYPLIQFPLMVFSNFVTVDEAEFYMVLWAERYCSDCDRVPSAVVSPETERIYGYMPDMMGRWEKSNHV